MENDNNIRARESWWEDFVNYQVHGTCKWCSIFMDVVSCEWYMIERQLFFDSIPLNNTSEHNYLCERELKLNLAHENRFLVLCPKKLSHPCVHTNEPTTIRTSITKYPFNAHNYFETRRSVATQLLNVMK